MAERCIYSHNFSHSCSWQLWKTRTQGRGCRRTARWSSKLAQSFWCQNIFDLSQQVCFYISFPVWACIFSEQSSCRLKVSGCAFLRESGGGAEGCRIFAHCKNVAGHVTGVGTRSRGTLAGQNLVTLQTSHLVSFLCSVFVLHVWSGLGLLYRSVSATNSEKIDIDILHL